MTKLLPSKDGWPSGISGNADAARRDAACAELMYLSILAGDEMQKMPRKPEFRTFLTSCAPFGFPLIFRGEKLEWTRTS